MKIIEKLIKYRSPILAVFFVLISASLAYGSYHFGVKENGSVKGVSIEVSPTQTQTSTQTPTPDPTQTQIKTKNYSSSTPTINTSYQQPPSTSTPESTATPEPEETCNDYARRAAVSHEEYNYGRALEEAKVTYGLAENQAKHFYATCHSNTCDSSYMAMIDTAKKEYENTLAQIEIQHSKNLAVINGTCY